jgi:hypothetical protein
VTLTGQGLGDEASDLYVVFDQHDSGHSVRLSPDPSTNPGA